MRKAEGSRPRVTAVLTWLAMGAVLAAQTGNDDAWVGDLIRFGERLVEEDLTPGMGVAVVTGDRIVLERGFGSADQAARRPVGSETPFYIASSSKSLTGLAVLLLAEADRIDLDAPMTRYLAGLKFHRIGGIAQGDCIGGK